MARPRKIPTRSIAELKAAIAEESEQHALLQRDLHDALVAGENTSPYRRALAETGEVLAELRAALEGARRVAAEAREAACREDAASVLAEAQARHSVLLEPLRAPSFPLPIEKEIAHDLAA